MNKIIICIFILITSCSSLEQRSKLAFTIANKAGFSSVLYQDSGYSIQSFAKKTNANSSVISIYIEGDGRSWIDRNTISSNPTPTTPLALELAALDQSPKVIYLARPCQYVSDPKCSAKVWTSHQFSQAVVMSYMQVLDQIKKQHNNKAFHIIAYSGGATIALMLGAQRNDIQSIRTIAGNLDHAQLSAITKTTPLVHSVAPQAFIAKTQHIPQLHYYGGQDKVIPEKIYLDYNKNFTKQNCITVQKIAALDHHVGWDIFWQNHAAFIPTCTSIN